MKNICAVKIDPFNKEVKNIAVEQSKIKSFYEAMSNNHVKCDMIEMSHVTSRITLLLDEEGSLKENEKFWIKGCSIAFHGIALVVHFNGVKGEWESARMIADEIKPLIQWKR